MIQTDNLCLLDCGQQSHAGTQQFHAEDTATEYLLLMCGIRTMLRINDRQYYMQPFTFLLLPFEEENMQIEAQGMTAYRYLHLRMQTAYVEKLKTSGMTLRETHTLARPLAVEEIWKILLAESEDSPTAPETREHALHLLLCLLREATDGTIVRAAEVPHYDKLSVLRHKIYLNPSQSWFIQNICQELGISRPYFHKIYLAAFGTTCTQDVIASRIACAKKLLETTDDAISAVSQKSGFETDVYFMRQFKRHVGMTPTAYRRIYRQSKVNMKEEQ